MSTTAPVATGVRWVLLDSWTLTLRGLAHWRRNPGPVVFALAFNIVVVLMFVYLFGGSMRVPGGGDYRDYLIPGMFTMTMLFGIGATALAVTTDVDRGVTDRFRSMPISAAAVLIGRAAGDMLLSVMTLTVMILTGLVLGWHHRGSLADLCAAVALILLLRFALIWIGIYLGLAFTSSAAIIGVQTAEFPIGALSGVFVATTAMPGWLRTLADWNPLSATVNATRALFGSPGVVTDSWVTANSTLMAVLWPAALLLIFIPLSINAFRNLSR
ncbi:ABC transporter permease [Nocardia sp. XZ_19_369]|uniref:ABC transporter permease n=1 Tax=Nocardia sp. XZ_19_369 TaxID=2769487 RepID=UPI0027D2BC89|nr:ABC transporter permease [Nocardia sp. XZ_19_369]